MAHLAGMKVSRISSSVISSTMVVANHLIAFLQGEGAIWPAAKKLKIQGIIDVLQQDQGYWNFHHIYGEFVELEHQGTVLHINLIDL